jgi:L1 cell adhesion molecule like protein
MGSNPEAEKLKESGNAMLAASNFKGASEEYSKAIQLAPENYVLYSNRSAAKLKLGDSKGAVEDAEKCVSLAPTWTKGHSRLGAALHAAGDFDAAITAYAKGLSLEPSNTTLSQGLSSVMEAKGSATKQGGPTYNPEAPEVDPIVGIDLGTTYSCVGVWEGEGVVIIPDAEGRKTTPSVVSYMVGEGGEIERLVGHDAKRKMTTNSEGTIFDAKRLIGQRFKDEQVQRDVEKLPFKVEGEEADGKPRITIPKLSLKFTPEEISAVILGEMKKIAEAYMKRPVTRAIITVPAYFSDAQRQATKDAGAIAGLNVLRVINEPTAAALAYGLDSRSMNAEDEEEKKKERKILVFDLGGGTFDVSVLSIENGVFEVMSTGGDTHLGGEDFDTVVAEYLHKEIKHKYKVDVEVSKKARLKVAAEQAKIALSNGTTTRVALDGIIAGDGNFIEFTREKFDKLNEEPFKRCMETVKRVLKDAKLKYEDIGDVVLVGGSTRIPTIREKLRDLFGGKQLCQSINPDEAVAYGAAVQGAIMSRASAATSQLILVDVCPLSLGIECTGKVFSVVIPRNTALPVKRTKTYSTEEDYQTAIDVRIFEGERQITDGNNLLGEFTISGIERAKRGEPKVEVTFSISVEGILQVSALDTKTGANGKVAIAANSGRLSQDDIAKMLADAEKYRKQDEMRTQRLEAVNELDTMLGEIAEMPNSQVGKSVRARAQKAREWLDEQGGRESASLTELQMRIKEIWGEARE